MYKDEEKSDCSIFEIRLDKIRDRYSVGVSAAHQLPCTVPAAGQSLSVDKQSVQTQPGWFFKNNKSIIKMDIFR
jgi:hypothetical protein